MSISVMPLFLSFTYYLLLGLFGVSLILTVKKKTDSALGCLAVTTILNGAVIFLLIATEHRLPLYGHFEGSVYILFIVTLLEILFQREYRGRRKCAGDDSLKNGNPTLTKKSEELSDEKILPSIQPKTCGGTALLGFALLLFIFPQPKVFNDDFFMYGNLWVNLFFNLRLAATAIFCRAALMSLVGIWSVNRLIRIKEEIVMDGASKNNGNQKRWRKDPTLFQARNLLLMGLAVFLCSEWSGSWWCLNWLGDSWRWSNTFFKAAVVFILVMLACHLPPSLAKSLKIKALIGTFPMLFLLWTLYFH